MGNLSDDLISNVNGAPAAAVQAKTGPSGIMNAEKDECSAAGGGNPIALTQEIEALQKKVSDLEGAVQEFQDARLRAQAEAENTRRRAQLDIEKAHKYGAERFARELLNVLDSFDHGLDAFNQSSSESPTVSALYEGMQLTYKLLLDSLAKFGVTPIVDGMGEPFDPQRHEALSIQVSEELPDNRILHVVQKGFMIAERVLRPARVIVSKSNRGADERHTALA